MTTRDTTIPSRFSRWLIPALALAFALTLGLLAPAAPVRAEIVDFDPETDDVPVLVEQSELELIQTLQGAGFQYLMAQPSPGGTYAYGYFGEGVGFMNLETGKIIEPVDDPMGYTIGDMWWQDDTTLGMVTIDILTDDQGEPTEWQLYRVLMTADLGDVESQPLTTLPLTYSPIAASPDLGWLLALEVPTGTAPTQVTLRPSYDKPSPLPDGLPGVLGENATDSITLQQAPSKLVLQSVTGDDKLELAELPTDSGVFNAIWSPDGSRVMVGTSTMPDWDGDRARDNEPPGAGLPNLGSINVQEALGNVAPADNPLVTGTRLHVFDTASGDAVKVFENTDYQQGLLRSISWSPGGTRAVMVIANRSELDGRPHPVYANPSGISYWLLDASLSPAKEITGPGLDSLSAGGAWLDDDTMLFAVPDELDTRLATYDFTTDSLTAVWSRPGSSWQVVAGGGKVVFPHATVNAPMELWVADAADVDGTARAVTDVGADIAAVSRLKTAEITWQASSGRTLTGLYVYRDDMPFPPATPGPVVVWQQGGPGGQMTNNFGSSVESPYSMLPQFGIPVFMANAAGRTVQDAQFYSDMAEGRNFGQLDIQQIKEGVDALVARKIVDPARVGITGCSYGGYFTLQSIRTYPDFYAAANAQCSLMDLFEEFTFGYTPFVSYLMGASAHGRPGRVRQGRPAVRRQGRDHAHAAVPRAAGLPTGGAAGAVSR